MKLQLVNIVMILLVVGCRANVEAELINDVASDCPSGDATCSTTEGQSIDHIELELTNSEGVTADHELTIAWEAEPALPDTAVYQGSLAPDASCATATASKEVTGGSSMTIGDVPEGEHFLCLKATLPAGVLTAKNNGIKITVDRTAPAIGDLVLGAKNAPFSVSAIITDPLPITLMWEKASGSGDVTFSASAVADPTVSVTVEGAYEIRLTATDSVGNKAEKVFQFIYDVTPPVVDVGADRFANAALSQTATVSGAAQVMWSKISGPGDVTFSASDNAVTSVSASADGVYVLRLTATDLAGNGAYDEFVLNWLTSGPQFISLTRAGVAADGQINDAEKNAVTPVFVLAANGYATASYSFPWP